MATFSEELALNILYQAISEVSSELRQRGQLLLRPGADLATLRREFETLFDEMRGTFLTLITEKELQAESLDWLRALGERKPSTPLPTQKARGQIQWGDPRYAVKSRTTRPLVIRGGRIRWGE